MTASGTSVFARARLRRLAICIPAALLALPLAACAQNADGAAGIANVLKQRTEPGPAADFVQKTRPALDPGFVPANAPRAEPATKPLGRDQIKALEAELDAARARHDAIARRPATRASLRSSAGDPYVAPKKKQPAKCVLTCEIK